MSAFPELAPANEPIECRTRTLDGSRTFLRIVACVMAFGLLLSAVLIWLRPDGSGPPQTLLPRMLLSMFAFGAAVALLRRGLAPLPPIVEIDAAQGLVRLLCSAPGQTRRLLDEVAFEDLGWAECHEPYVAFWSTEGRLIAEVVVPDTAAFAILCGSLKRARKLR